jgi:hypothetical protein
MNANTICNFLSSNLSSKLITVSFISVFLPFVCAYIIPNRNALTVLYFNATLIA